MQTSIAVSPFRKWPVPLWLIAPALQAAFLCFLAAPAGNTARTVQGSFLAITALASFFLFKDSRPFSLYQIWWLFYIVFMGVVPAVHYDMGVMPWRNGDVSNTTHLQANVLIISALLLFAGVYHAVFSLRQAQEPRSLQATARSADETPNPSNPLLRATARSADETPTLSNIFNPQLAATFKKSAFPIVLFCGAGVVMIQGFPGLLLRGHAEEVLQRYDGTFLLLFDKIIRGAMLAVSVIGIMLYRTRPSGSGLLSGRWLTLLLLTCVLFNFPLSMPRYLVAAIYLAWVVAWNGPTQRWPHLFKSVLLFGMLAIAPIANVSRYSARAPVHVQMNSIRDYYRVSFLTADFDPYASLCRTMMFVTNNGHTAGRQAIGVAAFFVPRAVWPQKPVGSGYTVYAAQGFEFRNVACTLLAEGVINADWPGALFITLLCSALVALYDRRCGPGAARTFSYAAVFYPVSIGMLLFLLRGDLLSSFAYTAGLAVSGWTVYVLLRWMAGREKAGRNAATL